MKSILRRSVASYLRRLGILVLASLVWTGCDSGNPVGDNQDIEKSETEILSTKLDNQVLYLEHNLLSENISVRIDGLDGLTETEVTFTKIGAADNETRAQERLESITIDEEVNPVAHRFFIDAGLPNGTRVDVAIKTPRPTSIRVRMMAGKLEIYDVDGAIDVEIWRGWVTVLTASPNIKGYVDHGDVLLNLRPCRSDRQLEWEIQGVPGGDSRLTVTVPQEPYQANSLMSLAARVEDGPITITDIPVQNAVRTPLNSGQGELLTGRVANTVGTYDLRVRNGSLNLQSWSQVQN